LISGINGGGKTTFFRVLAGQAPALSGHIEYNGSEILKPLMELVDPSEILFLPQVTYLPLTSSVRECISYPLKDDDYLTDEECEKILEQVGLDYQSLIARQQQLLQATIIKGSASGMQADLKRHDWHHLLSPGEAQKLSMARALYHRPRLLLCDEATAAMDMDSERQCITQCLELGMRILWITHRQQQLSSLAKWNPEQWIFQEDGHVERRRLKASSDVTTSIAVKNGLY
jgi:ABC-type uncharacterized transport system fused permease/ATPase subunit